MSALTDFLLARIAEDEAVAERCIQRNQFGDITGWHSYRHQLGEAVLPRGTVAVPAPGFLADCAAKRRIVERCALRLSTGDGEPEGAWELIDDDAWADLYDLALPYADHPEYREEWKP